MHTSVVLQPTTVDELAMHLDAYPSAQLLAGGTLIVPVWQQQRTPSHIVYLPTVATLHVREENSCGAVVTLAHITQDARYPLALREAAMSIGGPAVRNLATIGGNLAGQGPKCLAVALLVLQATVEQIKTYSSPRTGMCELSEALAHPDALITSVHWKLPDGACSTFLKLGLRATGGPNLGAVAVRWGGPNQPEACAIAVGSTGTLPSRIPEAEEQWRVLAHDPLTAAAATARIAGVTAPVVGDSLASEPYRRHLITVLVQRAFLKLIRMGKEKREV